MLYVYNMIIIPQLEYYTQLTFILKDLYHSLITFFRILFKHKLNLNKCISNVILHTNLLYNLRFLYNIKIQSIFMNLICQLNDHNITDYITLIRVCQL